MKTNKHKMYIQTTGKDTIHRYRIYDVNRGYWGGDVGWTAEPLKSILYYSFEDAARVMQNIQTMDNLGKPMKKFTAQVNVELIGGKLDRNQLIDYLAKEARLLLANASPDGVVQLQIDWNTLQELPNDSGGEAPTDSEPSE